MLHGGQTIFDERENQWVKLVFNSCLAVAYIYTEQELFFPL